MRGPASAAVFLWLAVGLGVGVAQEEGAKTPPAKKAAPSFTDDDLARYREDRVRDEQEAGSLTTAPPPASAPERAQPLAPPRPPAAPPAVVLEDLNRTLPPEYFEGAQVEPGGLAPTDKPHHRRRLAVWLEGGGKPSLRQLLAPGGWTSVAPGFEHERLVRALSWSVVDFMMGSGEGHRFLRSFMGQLKEQRGLHSLVALERTYPDGVAAFERQWLEHVAMGARVP